MGRAPRSYRQDREAAGAAPAAIRKARAGPAWNLRLLGGGELESGERPSSPIRRRSRWKPLPEAKPPRRAERGEVFVRPPAGRIVRRRYDSL